MTLHSIASEAIYVGTSDFCRNFPSRPKQLIPRDSIYEHVDTVFDGAARCIIVEGDVQSGKSEFLAGYMLRNPQNSIGVFLSPGDSYFYSPEFIRIVLGEQIAWLLTGQAGNFDSVSAAEYKSLLYKLQRAAKQSNITFVIDGLIGKSSPEGRLKSEILDLLPFGQQSFQFLISGESEIEHDIKVRCRSVKSVPLMQVGLEEATEFFKSVPNLQPKDIYDIRRFCGGSIGRLTKFKAILEANRGRLDDILGGKTGEFQDLLDMEWANISNIETKTLLAYLSFSNRPLTIDELEKYTGTSGESLRKNFATVSFVNQDEHSNAVSLRSDIERKFLQRKLSEYEKEVQAKLIDELLRNPNSAESDRHLPAQLMQSQKYDELFGKLDTAHFCRLLSREKSLRSLRANFDIGLKASKVKNNDVLAAKFGMGKSVVGGLEFSTGSQSRIGALVSMSQIDDAIELALSSPTREERLRNLAATAKSLYDEKRTIPSLLKEEIKTLLADVQQDTLGNLAIPIACDLIAVDLEAAISLFNSANAVITHKEPEAADKVNGENATDTGTKRPGVGGQSEFELRLSERMHRKFAHALGQMVDRTPAEKLIQRLSNSADVSTDLIFIKEWIGRRRDDPEAFNVANASLDAILKDLTRSPRIEDLRVIALVLPHTHDKDDADKLGGRIKALASTDFFLGTSIEGIRLRLLLLEVDYRIRRAEAELSLLEMLIEVEAQTDISVRTACLSWILHGLKQFQNSDALEASTSLISHATELLMQAIELLLANSADHFAAVRTALPALARADAALACKLCGSLNTESRRDSAYLLLLSELITLKTYEGSPALILEVVESVADEHYRSTGILSAMSIIVDNIKSKRSSTCNPAVTGLWKKLRISNYRFIGLRYALKIEYLLKVSSESISALERELDKSWSDVGIEWVRWDLGYALVRDTYAQNPDYAEKWLGKIAAEEATIKAPSESLNDVLKLTASLGIRAFSYLADDKSFSGDDFNKLVGLINSVAVPDEKLLLWCELGIRLHYAGKKEFSKYICRTHVEPLLPIDLKETDQFGQELTIAQAAPFIYITHESTGQFLVEKITSTARRDATISNICFTLLRKVANTDAYKDPSGDGFDLDTDTCASIIALMAKMSTDWAFFGVLEAFTTSLSARKNERKFRRTQAADYLNSLESICRKIMPDKKNIKHDGFLISSLSYINRARQVMGIQVPAAVWIGLYNDARNLSNVSDRAVVTTFVTVGARAKAQIIPDDWLASVRADISACPTLIDQVDRCAWLAEILENFDKKASISLARQGMTLTKDVGPEINVYSRKQKLLDIVYNIDPELADDFIELADGDRARKNDKKALEARLKLQRLQKEAATDPDKVDLNEESDKDISELSIRNLAALNANRISARPVDDFKRMLTRAPSLPFESAYSVWSWALENAIRKGGSNSKGEKVIVSLYHAVLASGELLASLLHGNVLALGAGSFPQSGLVKPGGRDSAFTSIMNWAKQIDGQTITITDPYFGPEDVDLLFEIAKAAPSSDLQVLTGRRHLKKVVSGGGYEEKFNESWRSICDVTPSDISIFIIGVNKDGDHPIHDRWIVANNTGLRLGTSANSLGVSKISEVSQIEGQQLADCREMLCGFLERKVRMWEGERVSLSNFMIE